ncbi:MAG: DUF2905 domain-containing protein [Methanoregulaceae archaeon]|jgi:hypothetical protein|nr:DUF2905 domain-containing protein [Methanoregulaceae archaeon]
MFGRLILTMAVILAAIGLLVMLAERYPAFRFGRLPGDIMIERGETKIFIPITSMLLFSLLISLGFALLRVFKR